MTWPKQAKDLLMRYLANGGRTHVGQLQGAQLPSWIDFQRIEWPPDVADLSRAIIECDVIFGQRRGEISLVGAQISGTLAIRNCKLGALDLHEVVVEKQTDIQKTNTGTLSAANAKFVGGLVFTDRCAASDVDFTLTEFGSEGEEHLGFDAAHSTDFAGSTTTFSECIFWGTANANLRILTQFVDFTKTRFESHANFNGVQFGSGSQESTIVFDSVRFEKTASFRKAEFRGQASFKDMVTHGLLDLDLATFSESITINAGSEIDSISAISASFNNFSLSATIAGNTNFEQAEFQTSTRIDGRFDGVAIFHNAKFSGNLDISNVRFNKRADFSTSNKLTFDSVLADSAAFMGEVNFENRVFSDETSFVGTTFEIAPRFYGAKLHPSTTFGEIDAFHDFSMRAIKRYQLLRHMCEELRSRHEEGVFHALEQRARCKSGPMPRSDRVFSSLYDFAAVYGTSLSRTIWGLLIVWSISTLAFAFAGSNWHIDYNADIDWNGLGQAALTSASNIFSPFFQFRESGGFRAAACLAQSIIAVPLIAVFLLALRWRFRRG